jgi:two-component system, LytTR family, sensor kinase
VDRYNPIARYILNTNWPPGSDSRTIHTLKSTIHTPGSCSIPIAGIIAGNYRSFAGITQTTAIPVKSPSLITVRDKWFRIAVIILPLLLIIYTSGLLTLPFSANRLARFIVSLATLIIVAEGNRYLIYRSHQWGNGKLSSVHRIIKLSIIGLSFTAIMLALSAVLRKFIVTGTWDTTIQSSSKVYINHTEIGISLFGYSILNALTNFPALLVGYELLYQFAHNRHTKKEKEKLEKEKLRAELNQLKGIINPHFLFNNLNSLSSLISDNPAQAEIFLDELTTVFRYLLRNNEMELTTLRQELLFIKSYYHLLQTRYGSGITMTTLIDSHYEELMLPPLTLQLLVENAVKHNRIQKEQPLHIEICTTAGNKLVVRNNLNKKEGWVESTGIGLQNINARYRMLNRPEVIIEKQQDYFSVIISLVETISAPAS